jgi:sugar lactone lactonase YvrE
MSNRVVLDGLMFPEGPRWRGGRLFLSDIQAGEVIAVDEDGRAERLVTDLPGGGPSGLGWLPDGRLLIVATRGRALYTLEPDGSRELYADLSGLASYGTNDMVVDTSTGRAWVGCCDLGGMPRPAASELIVVHPDRGAAVADPALAFPNGSVLTPDGGTLIVAETFGQRLTAFRIGADGTLSDRRVWAPTPRMAPDGICLDEAGGVWFADPRNNACVRVLEGGEVTDRIEFDRGVYACTLGGADLRTLFVLTSAGLPSAETAATRPGRVEAVPVATAGAGSP